MSIVGGVHYPGYRARVSCAHAIAWVTPDPCRLGTRPEFKVLWPVVALHAIAVMNRLLGEHVAAEHSFHNKDVLEYVAPLARSGAAGCPRHDVARLMAGAATFPATIR